VDFDNEVERRNDTLQSSFPLGLSLARWECQERSRDAPFVSCGEQILSSAFGCVSIIYPYRPFHGVKNLIFTVTPYLVPYITEISLPF
jgi:hypothetical protein